jgi:hypothetical protein
MPERGFAYTKGAPQVFRRSDLAAPVTREFCGKCGTHLVGKAPAAAGVVFLKVGSLDDPSSFGGPEIVIYTCDKQTFHSLPQGVPTFDRLPSDLSK